MPGREGSDMKADTWPTGPAAGTAGRTGQRHALVCFAAKQVEAVKQGRAVMAHHCAGPSDRQRSGNQQGMLLRPVAGQCRDQSSRGICPPEQSKQPAPLNQPPQLLPRDPSSRKLGCSCYPG